ncbi:protein of unknown function [Caballeronia sp. S22]
MSLSYITFHLNGLQVKCIGTHEQDHAALYVAFARRYGFREPPVARTCASPCCKGFDAHRRNFVA